jgi:hypothetical protein
MPMIAQAIKMMARTLRTPRQEREVPDLVFLESTSKRSGPLRRTARPGSLCNPASGSGRATKQGRKRTENRRRLRVLGNVVRSAQNRTFPLKIVACHYLPAGVAKSLRRCALPRLVGNDPNSKPTCWASKTRALTGRAAPNHGRRQTLQVESGQRWEIEGQKSFEVGTQQPWGLLRRKNQRWNYWNPF